MNSLLLVVLVCWEVAAQFIADQRLFKLASRGLP